MKLRDAVLGCVVLAFCWAGCGVSSEGGIVGSGITAIRGTVVEVRFDEGAPPDEQSGGISIAAPQAPVLVSIDEAPGIESVTDAEGTFVLMGSFSGEVTVRFRASGDGRTFGALPVSVGEGSTVVLRDVEIRSDLDEPVQLPAPLQLNLPGSVVTADCATGTVQVDDESPRRNRFRLRLRRTSELVGPDGSNIGCGDLRAADRVVLEEGVIDLDARAIDVVRLRLDPGAGPGPDDIRVRRRGTVLRTTCDAPQRLQFLDDDLGDVVAVELSPGTDLRCGVGDPSPCLCSDVGFGDLVDVSGIRRVERPGLLDAVRVLASPNPDDSFVERLIGDIERINCRVGLELTLAPRAGLPLGRNIAVRLTAETAFDCGRFGGQCTCSDMLPGFRVAVEARIFLAQPAAAEALAVTVLATPRIRVAAQVVTVDCATGRLDLENDEGERFTVQLTRETPILFSDAVPASCADLGQGDTIVIIGRIRPSTGTVVNAEELRLRRAAPRPTASRSPTVQPTFTRVATRVRTPPTPTQPPATRPIPTREPPTRVATTRPTLSRPTPTSPAATRPTLSRPPTPTFIAPTRPTAAPDTPTAPATTRPTLTRATPTSPATTRPTPSRPTPTFAAVTRPATPLATPTLPATTRPTQVRLTPTRPQPSRPAPTRQRIVDPSQL